MTGEPGTEPTLKPHHAPHTAGVKTLLGDPKRAIVKLAMPMILAMSVQTIYNLVDAFWVSGLGADALAAVGLFFPFFFLSMALATGVAMGGGAAISRRIGARDKEGADSVAVHTIVVMLILAAVFTVPFFMFAENIFSAIGAGRTTPLAVAYGRIMFGGTLIVFFFNIAMAILRAEGDVNRAMVAMVIGAVLNIVLDPLFIITMGLGVAGAAWATILSMSVTSVMLAYWLFLKKDTYVTFGFKGFRFRGDIMRDIFRVGLPASVQHLSMSFTFLLVNIIIVWVGGTDGVAVFATGWRVAMIAILPLLGMATSVISVTGAAFGQRDYVKLDTAFMYAVRIGLAIEVVAAVGSFLLAPFISAVFTQSQEAARIGPDLTTFLEIMVVFYPMVVFGMLSSSMFQGTGKGTNALIVTFLRTVVLQPPLAYFMAFTLGWGLVGIWWGMNLANGIGVVAAFLWARHYIRCLIHEGGPRGVPGDVLA